MSIRDVGQAIDRTQHAFEQRLLEIIRRLKLGRDEALEELRGSRESLRNSAAALAEEIDSHTDELRGELEEIQRRLGELNLMLAEREIEEDIGRFDAMRERIQSSVRSVFSDLESIEAGEDDWSEGGSRMERAWQRFLEAVEFVRLHLEASAGTAAQELDDERGRLVEELGRLVDEPDQKKRRERYQKLEVAYERCKRVLKALLLFPEEAAPRQGDEPRRRF